VRQCGADGTVIAEAIAILLLQTVCTMNLVGILDLSRGMTLALPLLATRNMVLNDTSVSAR
jgi:hypothetical protein